MSGLFGIGEKIIDMVGSIFKWLYDVTIGPFIDIPSLQDLIFGKSEGESLVFNTFTQEELSSAYEPGVTIFFTIAVGVVLFAVVMAGMKVSGSGINPANRNYIFEFLKDIAIVTILLFNLPNLYEFIFWINDFVIGTVEEGFGDTDIGSLDGLKSELDDEQNFIGEMLINLTLVVLGLWAFFYYTMRKLTIMIFMILGPVMIALYLIPQTKAITGGYFREFVGTVLIQSVHAVAFFLISVLSVTTAGTIESIMLYIIFIPVGESIKGLFGLSTNTQSGLGKAATYSGMAAMGGVMGATKGALSGQGVTGTLQSMKNGSKNGKVGKGDSATDSVKTDKTNAPGRVSEKMLKAGDIVSKGGKAAVGSAGAIAGSALGPAGALAGAVGGSAVGGATGGIATRATVATGQGVNSRVQKGKGAFALSQADGDSTLKSTAKGLGETTGISTVGRQVKRAGSSVYDGVTKNPVSPIDGALSGLNNEFKIKDKVNQAGETLKHPKQSWDNHISKDPVGAQRNLQKTLGYAGGVVGGRKGHDLGNSLSQKASPYKNKAQEQAYSPKQIMQNAKKDANGNVAPESVNLVSTSEDSYIQVQHQDGGSKIVSTMSGGDSTLKKGQSTSTDISKKMEQMTSIPQVNHNIEGMLKKEVQNHQVTNQRNQQREIQQATRNLQGFKGMD